MFGFSIMKTAIILTYSAILLSFIVIVYADKEVPQIKSDTDDFNKLIDGIYQFSIQLLRETMQVTGEKNIIISPLSLWTLASLMSEGASGDTLSEMTKTLKHLDKNGTRNAYNLIDRAISEKSKLVQMEINNNIFMTKNIQPAENYLNLARTFYKTNISFVDFTNESTVNQMNQIIELATHGKFKNTFKNTDQGKDILAILSNTIYFKGKWTMPFNKNRTREVPFFDTDGQVMGSVNMMQNLGPFSNLYFRNLESEVVELPFGDPNCNDFYDILPECNGEKKQDNKSRYSMFAVVPDNKVSLDMLLKKLSETSIRAIYDRMDKDPMKNMISIDLGIPRFLMKSDISMKDILMKMGIKTAFDSTHANFSIISPKNNLFLSKVYHKALIEVSEEGTEASAVSSATLNDRMTPADITLNRPFVYAIIETSTNAILFIGTYGKPSIY